MEQVGRDIFTRTVCKGKTMHCYARVWDAELYLAAQNKQLKKDDADASIVVITKEEYRNGKE